MRRNMREQTCCFTGHRNIPPGEERRIACRLEGVLRLLIEKGIQYFGCGGARGFDLMAADRVLRLKKEYSHIKLIMVLPCQNQTCGWRAEDVRHYKHILSRADKVVYVQEQYSPGCMQKRNRHLVDHSSICVAYCTKHAGGSAYTVEYARSKGIHVVLLN